MNHVQKVLLVLSVFVLGGCGLFSQLTAPTAYPHVPPAAAAAATPASTAVAPSEASTAGPTQDACAQEPLRAYMRTFAPVMAEYEFSLVEVFSLTMTRASNDKVTAAIDQVQSARDSTAALQPPYCAQKMQTALLSSMDHLISGMRLRVAGESETKVQTELTAAQADQKVVEAEFGVLSEKAGLSAVSPTP